MGGRAEAIAREKQETAGGWRGKNFIDLDRLEKDWGIKPWKPSDGDNFIAIIPPEDEDAYYGTRIYVHNNVGPDKSNLLCPREHKKGPACPICEEREALRSSPDADDEEVRSLNCYPPKHIFLILDMASQKTMDAGVQLFIAGVTINNAIMDLSEDPRTGAVIDITDLDKGFDLYFKRKGKGLRTEYSGFRLEPRDPLPEEPLAQIENMPPLEDFLSFLDYEEIAEEFFGTTEAEEKPAEKPAPSSSRRRRGGRSEKPEAEPEKDDEFFDKAQPVDEPDDAPAPAEIGRRVRDRVKREKGTGFVAEQEEQEPLPGQEHEQEPEQEEKPEPKARKKAAPRQRRRR